jgi:hypothetical protein
LSEENSLTNHFWALAEGLEGPSIGAGVGRGGRALEAAPRDSTKYGLSRSSTRSHTLHHTQRISRAAALGETRAILDEVRDGLSERASEQQKLTRGPRVGQRHGASEADAALVGFLP